MFKITPIGSCRIYGPLREFGEALGFQINAKRVFGYMHSSAEAVQQMHAFTSDFRCEDVLWPLIARGKDYAHFQAEVHEKSDLYVIELASAKVIKIDDTVLQLNYLTMHYNDFFSDKARAVAFNQLCLKDDPAEVEAFLEAQWSSTVEQKEDSAVLKRIKISMSTEQSLYEDICKLKEGLPNIMIMTHVNAKNKNSTPLLTREHYINQVIAATERAGVKLYNPTDLMETIGQENAIADHSTGFAHFTGEFNGRIFADWYDNILQPMVENAIHKALDETVDDMLVPIVNKALEIGPAEHVEKVSSFLNVLSGAYPEHATIQQLKSKVANNNA